MARDISDKQTINALRRGIGALAIALPLILALGHFLNSNVFMQPTVSHFYYVPVLSDIMVGTMCAVGGFLIAYRGYEWSDHITSTIAGLSVIGVALFGTNNDPGDPALGFTRAIVDITSSTKGNRAIYFELHPLIPLLHVACAGLFFLASWTATRFPPPFGTLGQPLFSSKHLRSGLLALPGSSKARRLWLTTKPLKLPHKAQLQLH